MEYDGIIFFLRPLSPAAHRLVEEQTKHNEHFRYSISPPPFPLWGLAFNFGQPPKVPSEGWSVGRSTDCDVVIRTDEANESDMETRRFVSRVQFFFTIGEKWRVRLRDASLLGTSVNEEPIEKASRDLKDNARISFGPFDFLFLSAKKSEHSAAYEDRFKDFSRYFLPAQIPALHQIDNLRAPLTKRKRKGVYQVVNVIARSKSSTVEKVKHNGHYYVLKTYKKVTVNPQNPDKVILIAPSEFEYLRNAIHPNIVKVIDEIRVDEKNQLVTEYVPFGDLHTTIGVSKPTPDGAIKRIISQTSSALEFLHTKRIVHRDVKPDNILFTMGPMDKMNIKLIDFGLARNKVTNMDTICGTAGYMAPEILLARTGLGEEYGLSGGYNDRVDTWSLGVLLYVLLTKHVLELRTLLEYNRHSMDRIKEKWTWEPLPGYPSIESKWQPLLKGLLHVFPMHRFTAQQCLNHDALKIQPGDVEILDLWDQEKGHNSSYYTGHLSETPIPTNSNATTIRLDTIEVSSFKEMLLR